MELSILLVLLFGVLLGWLFGHFRGRTKMAALRRQVQIDRVGTREQIREELAQADYTGAYDLGSPDGEASDKNNTRVSSLSSNQRHHASDTAAETAQSSFRSGSPASSAATASFAAQTGLAEIELDELYQVAGKVKPLEFDLQQSQKRIAELEEQNRTLTSASQSSTGALQGASAGLPAVAQYNDQDLDELYQLAGRVKPLEFDLNQSRNRIAELEADTTSTDSTQQRVLNRSMSTGHTQVMSTAKATHQSSSFMSTGNNHGELDELYRISARVAPLEYDLKQRTLEIKALKRTLEEAKRGNEKQLVAVRSQAESQAGVQLSGEIDRKAKSDKRAGKTSPSYVVIAI